MKTIKRAKVAACLTLGMALATPMAGVASATPVSTVPPPPVVNKNVHNAGLSDIGPGIAGGTTSFLSGLGSGYADGGQTVATGAVNFTGWVLNGDYNFITHFVLPPLVWLGTKMGEPFDPLNNYLANKESNFFNSLQPPQQSHSSTPPPVTPPATSGEEGNSDNSDGDWGAVQRAWQQYLQNNDKNQQQLHQSCVQNGLAPGSTPWC
ncbi:hypothetical protein FOS14_23670 [Skermania sp. ID1734]|uniref:hypothetical protein n=1 Tax=Skermania sp. ID1734 TaxID=2597516 RepID=UPI00117DD492|nr:hypothetical protein [Skermania sp. ID1734]TSD93197.1 hypothetical protein FOS14_23670 [Skermania sp. ID1734]